MLAGLLLLSLNASAQRLAPPPAFPTRSAAALPDSIWYRPPVAGLDSASSKEVEAEAVRAAAEGGSFEDVFERVCAARPRGAPVADLFRGLIRWTRGGGSALFQGREDWPLHFIYGGYLASAYDLSAARNAAYAKEQRDAFMPGNFFDLDDYAVTLAGARWASRRGACGELRSLPPFRFGALPHGRLPSLEALGKVRAFVDSLP